MLTEIRQKRDYNKNYTVLALNCVLEISNRTILVSEIGRSDRNNNIKEK